MTQYCFVSDLLPVKAVRKVEKNQALDSFMVPRLFNQKVNYICMSIDCLSVTFSALADPTRRAILARLALGETSVMEIAKPFKISLPAITKHLKVLERSGLIARSRNAQWRPCRLKAKPMKEAVDWLEHYRLFWEQSFDRLDDYLRELQTEQKRPTKGKSHDRNPK
jgi:DNA-binding transcriptional ArsR family regulator